MRILKLTLSLAITIFLAYSLNRSWNFGTPIPPLGKFLDPFHGFWQNAEKPTLSDKTMSIPGLREEVTIIFDSLRIPHIFARNDEDLYFAQGYITATERLWQMEFQIMGAGGRISEILGDVALDYDRSQRRQGMLFAAQNALKGMESNPEILSAITSYTNGVNEYISHLDFEDLPVEYKLLDYHPAPWENLNMGLFLKNMCQTLNRGEHDFEMTNALKLFGKDYIEVLYADREPEDEPIVDNPGGWKFKPVTFDTIPLAIPQEFVELPPLPKTPKGTGSNNWAVAGSKTASGSPILCNDPHLNLNLPSLWFVAHLNSPSVNVMGATLPSEPGVVIGFNDSIAWGVTNAQRDLVDWYKIQFKDKSRNEYLSDGAWIPSRKVIEKFSIRGREPFYDIVTYTHHGPIVYDESFHGDSERSHYALRWIAHDESMDMLTYHKLNRAKNHTDYMEALNFYVSPAQNFVFASTNGDIAIRIQGKFPVRRKNEGRFVLDGTKTSQEWKAFIPNDHNITIKNPTRGFVSSANQFPTDSTYPYAIHSDGYPPFRSRRINQVLRASSNLTPADMMRLQNDNYNYQAFESLPIMISHMDTTALSSPERAILSDLKKWDFFNVAESSAATYYSMWWKVLYAALWDEVVDSKVALDMPTEAATIRLMRLQPDFPMFNAKSVPAKESLTFLIRHSFSTAVENVSKWEKEKGKTALWSDYKDTYVRHLATVAPFSVHAKNGGGPEIVNASRGRNGPSWRMIVSLEKSGIKAWGVYPGGQSGNPGSVYYDNMIEPWENSQPPALKFASTAAQLSKNALFTTTLKPISK